jgi:ferritin-like metal-binding protein YciE
MATFINLRNLLEHQIEDLYSAEEQIIEALPKMAEGATDRELKKALNTHLRITRDQKKRLDQIRKILKKNAGEESENSEGFLERIFGGGTKCKGMEGLIKEGNKVLDEEMESTAVKDAAIIAAAQKVEHYEISGYGTARAYAREVGLRDVEKLLAVTLKEEYTSDKMLNALALNKINLKAETSGGTKASASTAARKQASKKSTSSTTATNKTAPRKTSGTKRSR